MYSGFSSWLFMWIRIESHNKQGQEIQAVDYAWFIGKFSATLTEFYTDQYPSAASYADQSNSCGQIIKDSDFSKSLISASIHGHFQTIDH